MCLGFRAQGLYRMFVPLRLQRLAAVVYGLYRLSFHVAEGSTRL